MAEALISPGVFLRENDLSQITAGPITVGSALIGPTVIGKVNIPTLVTSYSEYKAKFGTTFVSGGNTQEYLTSIAAYNYFQQGGTSLLVTRVTSGSNAAYTPATSSAVVNSLGSASFELTTLSVGNVMNNNQGAITAANGLLPSGSANNIRWQITNADSGSGYFTLIIRQGNDYTQGQTVLETWTNLSLDPNQNNYVAYVIGDQTQVVAYDEDGLAYLQNVGSYPNQSRYVRVSNVFTPTPNYLNPQGRPVAAYTASIPLNGSGSANGSFGTAKGDLYGFYGQNPLNLFEAISSSLEANTGSLNTQGLLASDYDTAIDLLANTDAYVYNAIYAPGINSQNAPNQVSALLATSQNRGDNIAVVDMVGYGQGITTVSTIAQSYDNSYGATYWPWLQIRSTETGRLHFVPASTVIPGVYEYNDKVSAEWFAPAGLNRGGLPTVIQPEYRLTVNQRNSLYTAKVNPIAVFPGQGTVVYGQKTLQARASALDRVNVRRLLIALKGYIGQIAQTLVFEQNTAVTRNKFLSQVNPYLEYVQQKQGLYAFRVVMDETNNTPDVIDRNLLVGAIYLQPTRTAEFIQLDFNILPTGVTFG